MRHIDDGHAQIFVDMLDFILHMLAKLLVERAERLVHQNQLRLEHQRARQRDALLLAARQLCRLAVGKGAHLHHVQRPAHLLVDLALRHLSNLQREGQVFGHRHMREQRIVLEHHADAALVRRDVVDRPAAELDLAMRRGLETGQHHQAGRLARTGRPEHGDELAGLDIEVQVFDDERLAVVTLLHIAKTYKRIGTVKHVLFFQTVSPNIKSG